MDSNIDEIIQNFTENGHRDVGIILDTDVLEQNQRKFNNELIMKREQVEQLRKELDYVKMENYKLKQTMEATNTKYADIEHHLNLALKNGKALNDRLEERDLNFAKTRLQQDSLISENQSLKELLQKAELEKSEQFQKINELKSLHDMDVSHHKIMMDHQSKFKKTIAKFSESVKSLERDHENVSELMRNNKLNEELYEKLEAFKNKYDELEKEKNDLEENYTIVKAKLEKFEELMFSFPFLQPKESTIVYDEYCRIINNLRSELKMEKETVSNLIRNLNDETEVTIKLCEREGKLQQENEELKDNLLRLQKVGVEISIQTDLIGINLDKIKQEDQDVIML